MKYKVLLIGRNKVMMGEFFQYLEEDFEMQTSSMRNRDIMSHIHYYNPDAIIYCMNREEKERMEVVTSLKEELARTNTVLVLTGNLDECEEFQKLSDKMSELILKKPITVRTLKDKVVQFLDEKKAEEAVRAAAQKAEEETRAAAEKKATEEVDETEVSNNTETNSADEAMRIAAAMKAEEEARMAEVMRIAAQVQAATETSTASVIAQAQGMSGDVASAKKHILVIDDDPMMLKLIKEQLKDSYSVATAISGAIGLKFLENKKTDMIILDYEMPGENGAQVLEKIRKKPETSMLPVVFLTGIKDREKIRKVVELKPQGYLLKPIESEQLIKTIKNIIG